MPHTTPFIDQHRQAGAKLVEFAGWLMPIQYQGILQEHERVRQAVGMFDVSHMGEIAVTGPEAEDFLDRLLPCDIRGMDVGKVVYTPMCLPTGGIVDDLLVYKRDHGYLLVVNAANTEKDVRWVQSQARGQVKVADESPGWAQLAVQGPRAEEVFRGHLPGEALALPFYRFTELDLWAVPCIFSRTGYTGEDGFEIYFHPQHARWMWEKILTVGQAQGIGPVGLGARDTLRLEMNYCLYGNDIDETTTPLEAGLQWTVRLDKGEFLGREPMLRQREAGVPRKLVAFEMLDRSIPRHGSELAGDGAPLGPVTSGTFSPSLKKGIGMGYVPAARSAVGTAVQLRQRGALAPGRIVKKPFYTQASHK
ncbi:MAG TPA: glycine cleavage system aminomethyltransferase GcvT [Candidatus Saccharimonadales bacterium]|nr:glycine cleavage system aminomethyltransferase GcvT [Candidatus Saccharimonadales bacterium]